MKVDTGKEHAYYKEHDPIEWKHKQGAHFQTSRRNTEETPTVSGSALAYHLILRTGTYMYRHTHICVRMCVCVSIYVYVDYIYIYMYTCVYIYTVYTYT